MKTMNTNFETRSALMSFRELSAYLNRGELTLRKDVKYGKIPFVKIGRTIRFKREDIDAWVESLRTPASV